MRTSSTPIESIFGRFFPPIGVILRYPIFYKRKVIVSDMPINLILAQLANNTPQRREVPLSIHLDVALPQRTTDSSRHLLRQFADSLSVAHGLLIPPALNRPMSNSSGGVPSAESYISRASTAPGVLFSN